MIIISNVICTPNITIIIIIIVIVDNYMYTNTKTYQWNVSQYYI